MCTQLSADSPLGPQVASSLRYCQLERGKMEGGRKAGRGRRKEGESDAESSGSSAGRRKREERRVWQEETRRRVMETRQDREAERWRGVEELQTNTLQDRRWDLLCKKKKKRELMICILMLWQLPFHRPARNTCWFCLR